jgi:hypothetical protein
VKQITMHRRARRDPSMTQTSYPQGFEITPDLGRGFRQASRTLAGSGFAAPRAR